MRREKNRMAGLGRVLLLLVCVAPSEIFAQKISAGKAGCIAICSDSTIASWGADPLGDGTPNSSSTLVHVNSGSRIVAVSSAHGSYALKDDGTLWAWSNNTVGEVGDNTTIQRLAPVQVHGINNIGYLNGVRQVSAGLAGHVLALINDSSILSWGSNNLGQLGNNSRLDSHVPQQINGLSGIIRVSSGDYYSLALKKDGTVYAWGNNQKGQLGDGTTGSPTCYCDSVPVKVHGPGGFLTGIVAISAGEDHSLALKNDSTVWAWGDNFSGELGNGTFASSGCYCSTVPAQVIGLNGIVAIAAGGSFSLALRKDSTVWAWGGGGAGALGNGTVNSFNLPVQVHGPGNIGYLSGIIAISTRNAHALALKADGSLWAWGYNYFGQLGNGTTNISGCQCDSFPVQVLGYPCYAASDIAPYSRQEHVLIYPNPVNNILRITISPAYGIPVKAKIFNSLGEELSINMLVNANEVQMQSQGLASGIYSVVIEYETKILTAKFIKE